MKTNFFILVSIVLLFQSCSPTILSRTAKTMDIYGSGVIQKPLVAELEVRNVTVTGTYTATGANIESIKADAVAEALKKANADVLVEPTFDIRTKNNKTTVNVSGFPGTYRNFRPIEEADLPLLEAGRLQKAEIYNSASEVKPKKSIGTIILLTVLGIAIVVGLLAAGGG